MNRRYRNLALWVAIAVMLIVLFYLFQGPQHHAYPFGAHSGFVDIAIYRRVESRMTLGPR